ncbi:MAG: hypothetical protein GY811_05095 [Myxococcales bacterium]|nr:hypothetical protein [Myxococcales bacterium]
MSEDSSDGKATNGDADGTRKRRRRRRKPAGAQAGLRPKERGSGTTVRSEAGKRPQGDRGPRAGGGGKSKRPARKRRSRRRGGGREGGDTSQEPRSKGDGRSSGPSRGERKPRRKEPTPRERRSEKPAEDDSWDLTPPPPTDSDEREQDRSAPPGPGDTVWGDDSDAETPDVELPAKLPRDVGPGEWDPTSAPLGDETSGYDGQLSARIANVIAVRFMPAGRLYLYDGGDGLFRAGDRVIVEAEHGKRVATVGTASTRKPPRRSLKRILRRATVSEASLDQADECREYLITAKTLAKKQGLGIKVLQAQLDSPSRLSLYYSCEQKTDVRGLSRALSKTLSLQVDLRHFGSRDEAKIVGGIGSCGQELCCSTWLPAFVPVSIRNAKEQGLVLNPTKVSGQCGRLKCCLVYEQALYSEMRKGLPKLGKRVITNDGFEGRVIEVDVLHQRIRVGIGRGESKVYGKGEVEPMFASQPQTQTKSKSKSKSKKRKGGKPQPDAEATPVATKDVDKEPSHDKN